MYFYNDKNYVLNNKLGIKDSITLDKAERILTSLNVANIRAQKIKTFSFETLKKFHKELFKDIYSWAGETRNVDISKGNTIFCPARNIDYYANTIFEKLKKKNYLKKLTKEQFCHEIAELFSDLNMLHPFREGNGRTEREFIYLLSRNAGYELDLTKLNRSQYIIASIESVTDSKKIEKLICGIIEPITQDNNLER